jgi:hypothetical protein
MLTALGLPANVTEPQALREFRGTGLSAIYNRARYGPLYKLALVYLPFQTFHVEYDLGRVRHSRFLALDRVEGALDLFEFPRPVEEAHLRNVAGRNCIQPVLTLGQAVEILREKVLRIAFQEGFFRTRQPRLEIRSLPEQFSIPYWLGFFGDDTSLRCRALDAVRRRMEGAKAAELFERWLAAA